MVTVSKSPSQISGGWLSGCIGGRGGRGGEGGCDGGVGRGTSFLMGGVTDTWSGRVWVGTLGGKVGLVLGSGGTGTSGAPSVGDCGWALVGGEEVG